MIRILLTILVAGFSLCASANSLQWRAKENRVTADIKNGKLGPVLKQIAARTGWTVYLEPDTDQTVSAKFKDLPPGDALSLLLGKLSFALVPGTNGSAKLLVFRTAAANATQLIKPVAEFQTNLIPNELIVRLKPGASIDDLAKKLGAKVAGKIPGLNAYRLSFQDEAAAQAARDQLAAIPEVASVDSNYTIDRIYTPSGGLQGQSLPPPPQLSIKPPPDNGRVIVGLIDTAVPTLGDKLDPFLLKTISIAGPAAEADPSMPPHGVSMAETILRSVSDVTRGSTAVQILPVDVYGRNESTSTFDVANGIIAAVNAGARVINLSLGSQDDSPFLHDTIAAVTKQNIAVFAAAGNEPVTTPFYPAAYPEVIAVTAIDQGQLAPYASRGSFVSVGAPGTSVVYYNNQAFYAVGTSTSAAFISGMAAGYMDATRSDPSKMQSFIRQNFGVKIGSGK